MPYCKNCQSEPCVKNGIIRGKQRYLCKTCGYNFVLGDARTSESIIAKKAMCVIFYSLGKASYNMLAKIFDTWPSLVYRWIKEAGLNTQEPHISPTIKEMELMELMKLVEMWHYINDKKTKNGSVKPLTVVQGELWHGCSAIVILQHSNDSMKK